MEHWDSLHSSVGTLLVCFESIVFLTFAIFVPPAGHDLKSLALNLASTLLILLPFAMYFYSEYNQASIGAVVGSLLLSLLVPPVGWRRPHPYSDDPSNTPYPRKAD